MSFFGLSGAQVALLWTALAAPLVALYLLRMHRRRIVVPFGPLWQRILADREPSSLWRRLRRLLSLLLQLAFVALLALALGDPRRAVAGRGARSIVLVVDCSASMQATDEPGGRLGRAQKLARQVVAGLSGGDAAMVIRMDGEPLPLSGWESDGHALERAIGSLATSDAAADWEGALALAEDALAGRPGPTIIAISDGAGSVRLRPARATGAALSFLPVGRSADNVGITAFSVRRYPSNRASYEVLLEIANPSPHATRRTLRLEADGEVIDTAEIPLAAGETARRFYPDLSGGGSGRLVAHLEPRDALPLDDMAYALLPPRKRQRVLLVTDGNLFLEGALLLDESLAVERVAPTAYTGARARGMDAVIFDRFAPAELPDAQGLLFVAPPKAQSPFTIRGQVDRPLLSETAREHPVLRWITLSDVNIARSDVFALAPGDVALAGPLHEPCIVAGRRGSHKVVALGFDLRKSDLPMRVAFPVLVGNALEWFGGEAQQALATLRTGRPWSISAGSASEVTLEDPSGARSVAPADSAGEATFFGRRVGFYKVHAGAAERTLAANLADGAETAIAPRPLHVESREVPPPVLHGVGPRARPWVWLALAALALTLGEWLSYSRRWTV